MKNPDAETLEKISQALEEIASADRKTLAVRWLKLMGHPPPASMPTDFWRRALAYEEQSLLQGRAADPVRRQLDRMAEKGIGDKPVARRLNPGTRMFREWKGVTHQVEVSPEGFEYQGKTYRSLSVIARQITGTRWSGPAFFGTIPKRKCHGQITK